MATNLLNFYSLERPAEEEKNINERLVITCPKNTFLGVMKLCLICYEYRESESNAYNGRGLARCCEERSRRKLLERMNEYLQDPATKFHEAAARLYMITG